MSQRKRPDGRAIWSPPRRLAFRIGRGCFNFFVGPFLTKLPDGTIQASMTRLATAAFCVAEIARLLPQQAADGGWTVPPIGWPDAFLAFCILFALPIDSAMKALAERNPERLLELLLARMGVGDVAQVATAPYVPHAWRSGDPDEGVI